MLIGALAGGDQISGPVWVPSAPPSLENYLAPTLQPIPLLPAIAVLMGLLYLSGAIKLWVTGRSWSLAATASFLGGCVVIAVVMGAGVEGYGLRMFSVFMFQQLTLMMAVPPLLVLGKPGTLLLRALPHNRLGRTVMTGARWGLRSSLGRVLIHPALMIPLFLGCFYGLYLSGAADTLLRTWTGHVGLEVLFLVAGILFTVPILSTDPLPARQSHMGQAVDVAVEMPLHAFFGVVLMMAPAPLVPFFASPPASWGLDPLKDQGTAGGLAWSYGELPTLIILLLILTRWFRVDTRDAAAADRRIDRDGNPELDAYNAYLAQLHRQGPAR
ncbi:cytochrome c oxidase assembly protein [uncultured Cellulomonas sp.]|uniref:cytochrome c oxidase assembly protein n=1 Tax=uncultured Cellulomonas sp. TaxID=189682 RepID=UPI00262F9EAC|nr:cytochrome c oxidase assembly protein [uncultured Cellulomonas sp.]